jgi:dienelactone hydrolase
VEQRVILDAAGQLTLDDDLDLTVSGVRPGSVVSVTASLKAPDGLRWSSGADFAADGAGEVRVAATAPLLGSYRGADPNGLLWSLAPQRLADAEASDLLAGLEPLDIELTCTSDGAGPSQTVAVTVGRMTQGTTWQAVRRPEFAGTLYTPPGHGPFRPVLVVGGSGGDANEPLAAYLAGHGYLALALPYFAAPGLPDELVDIELEYFDRALRWLGALPTAVPGPVAVVGRSRGGELALLLGLHFGADPVVAFVPSAVVHAGIRRGAEGWLSDVPAWRLGGRALPYLAHAGGTLEWRDGAIVCTPTYLRDLGDWQRVLAATMPLQECRSRVLLISGTSDDVWPSALFGELAASRLRSRPGGRHEHLMVPGAGHRFLPPVLPAPVATARHTQAAERLALGGTPAANARGGRLAYAAMLRTLGAETGAETDAERS